MKKTFLIILVVIVLIAMSIHCNIKNIASKPKIYNGAVWGMSMTEVQSLYKTMPYNMESDKLEYEEYLHGANIRGIVTYRFDATMGLKKIEIEANSIQSGNDKDIQNFESFFLDKQSLKLIDEATNFRSDKFASYDMEHKIYDRIYSSDNANIRSSLEKVHSMSYYYRANLQWIPASWKYSDTPSEQKAASSTKETNR
jgi:hypothetical protein